MSDYYQILAVSTNATNSEIKKAYRALALRFHPDKTGNDPECNERFTLIAEAYECLSDPEKRRQYDGGGSDNSFAQQPASQPSYNRAHHMEETFMRHSASMQQATAMFDAMFNDPFFGGGGGGGGGGSNGGGGRGSGGSRNNGGGGGPRDPFGGMAGNMFNDPFFGGGAFGGGVGGGGFGGAGMNMASFGGPGMNMMSSSSSSSSSSTSTSFGGGGASQSVSMSSCVGPDGRRVTKTTTTVRHPDGRVETNTTTNGDETLANNGHRQGHNGNRYLNY